MNGALVVDKPEGWTSHDVVNKVRRLTGTKKVGHLGTLDPIATGVLPLLLGGATRLAQFFERMDKVYEAIVRFGFSTDTYDRAGTPTSPAAEPNIEAEQVEAALAPLRGDILQTPPPVSAKKVGGVRAYELARKHVEVHLEPVSVTIHELTLLAFDGVDATLRARCSAGTYMRSIAHELGQALGCGAHLRDLRRTVSGDFTIEQGHTIADLERNGADGAILPAAQLLPEIPAVYIDAATEGQIRHGRSFPVSPFRPTPGSRYVKAVSRDGDLVAIGEAKLPHVYHPVLVLNG